MCSTMGQLVDREPVLQEGEEEVEGKRGKAKEMWLPIAKGKDPSLPTLVILWVTLMPSAVTLCVTVRVNWKG